MKKFFFMLPLFLTCCNFEPNMLVPPESTTATPSESPDTTDSTEVFVFSLAVSSGSALILGVGQTKALYLNVSLSDGAVYRGITNSFNTSHGELDTVVIWYSNDSDVVTVSSSGKVTAVAEGTTFIKASLGIKSATVAVQVVKLDTEPELTTAEFTDTESTSTDTTDAGNTAYSGVDEEVPIDGKIAGEAALNSDDYFIGRDDELEEHIASDGGYGLSSFPEIVYGLPEGSLLDVVSFGTKGKITIKFNNYVIVDGVGDDFIVFENVFGNWTEAAKVSVSDDGIAYHEFPCDAFGAGTGCAGVTATNYSSIPDDMRDPEISGGDSFDLADVGLSRAAYVKIVDQGTCVEDGFLCTSDTIGFDLDAVAIVNGENE